MRPLDDAAHAAKLKHYAKPSQVKLSEKAREAEVAAACDELARKLGWTVEKYEPGKASKIQPGLPDRRYVRGLCRVWVELKAPGGKLTREQHAFLVSEMVAGGHACAIEDALTLASILRLLDGSGTGGAAALRRCEEVTQVVGLRGHRNT